jgi:hypothetical protein
LVKSLIGQIGIHADIGYIKKQRITIRPKQENLLRKADRVGDPDFVDDVPVSNWALVYAVKCRDIREK